MKNVISLLIGDLIDCSTKQRLLSFRFANNGRALRISSDGNLFAGRPTSMGGWGSF